MAKKSISIDRLVPGMFLVGVDIGWMDTPFLRHKFLVKNEEMIAKLKACGVSRVEIDPEKGLDAEAPPEPVQEPAAAAQPAPEPVPRAAPATPPPAPPKAAPKPRPAAAAPNAPASFDVEVGRAKKIKAAGGQIMRKAFDTVRSGGNIDESMFGPLIEHTVGSTKRNSLAVLTMLHQAPGSKELVHNAVNQMSMAVLLARACGLEEEAQERVGTAALLMDVGWVRLPPKLLRQQYAYSDDEFRQVQEHVAHSVEILYEGGFDDEILKLVENHHERCDGSGYPEALNGGEISLECQILSLVNHFESRVHGLYDSAPAIPVKALRDIYTRGTEGGHDSALAKRLISLVGIYPMSSAVELDSGERGVVTKINWKQPMKPTVRIFYGRDRQPLYQPMEVDLAEDEGRKIANVIDPRDPANDPSGLLVFAEA